MRPDRDPARRDPRAVEGIGDVLLEAGVSIVGVPLSSPEPLDSIRRLSARFGDRLRIGAGTVMTASQVDEIGAAGRRLIVTPHADAGVVGAAKQRGMAASPASSPRPRRSPCWPPASTR